MTSALNPRDIAIEEYVYDLPDHRIARFPLETRDASKLLVFEGGQISQSHYFNLAEYIPEDHLLVFNTTKVVEARLFFKKATGTIIEVFCLEHHPSYPDVSTAMALTGSVKWNCLVGGAAKWKPGTILEKTIHGEAGELHLSAQIISRQDENFTILFEWSPASLSFGDILHNFGVIPIPPYLNRATEESDSTRYQTIYAKQEGSVAAPTAGLHFTGRVFEALRNKGVDSAFVTLHVGAGTFKPVKTERIDDHVMHAEFIDVDRNAVMSLLAANEKVIAVGTTSLRTLESLYWMGVKAWLNPEKKIADLEITQWEVYDHLMQHALPVKQSLQALLNSMDGQSVSRIICKTSIIITPGYKVRMARALITNFHQPKSTLLLLVAAIIGPDWKKIYTYALENDFRFLSYGDGALLWNHAL